MRLAVLGSGSGGNSVVVTDRETTILIDAGLSARQLCQRLQGIGVDPDSIDGILLSHEHSDHTGGLKVFLRKRPIPVYSNALTRELLEERLGDQIEWRIFQRSQSFQVGGITVEAFALPHDAVDPVGFVCEASGARVGFATDFGHVTTLVRERLRGVCALLVEANYDQGMLEEDTRRPWSIKQRISSRHGHLSNAQTAELVEGLLAHGLETVVLGHLSRDCNCPDLAVAVMRAAASGGQLDVHVASQDTPTCWVEIMEEGEPGGSSPVVMDQMNLAIG
ncbi:MAG TPA: metal-dependent hydrolase [Verrucomicrobiales bacterium]|nr:metal-dependent hydrolase [Deltaproteobacteria bacterium]MCS5540881.1 MBL fold metallo-hydrolase [Roseibacillus sp.]HAT19086.1 metal-dependent hydrolase [Verrucomicrobiales bacterium]